MSEGWPDGAVIRTPDRRLRVFVSSTLGELAAERRAHPREDLISVLVTAEVGALDEAQLLATCVTLLVAGHETTTSKADLQCDLFE